jgi:hypothetical protein
LVDAGREESHGLEGRLAVDDDLVANEGLQAMHVAVGSFGGGEVVDLEGEGAEARGVVGEVAGLSAVPQLRPGGAGGIGGRELLLSWTRMSQSRAAPASAPATMPMRSAAVVLLSVKNAPNWKRKRVTSAADLTLMPSKVGRRPIMRRLLDEEQGEEGGEGEADGPAPARVVTMVVGEKIGER